MSCNTVETGFCEIAAGAPPVGAASGDLSGSFPSPSVVQLQGRAVGAGAPLDNYALRWDGAAWTPGAPLPYEYHAVLRQTPSASSAPGLIMYVTLNVNLLGGIYFIALTQALSGSSSTTQIATDLVIDGVSYGGTLRETGITNGVDIYTGNNGFPFAAGAHTIALWFQHAGGPGTTTCILGAIQLWRVI